MIQIGTSSTSRILDVQGKYKVNNIDIFEKRSEDERIMFEQFDALEAYDYKYTNDFHIIDLMEFANDIVGILKEN